MPTILDPPGPLETANDRFKRGFSAWFWIGLTVATLLHAAIFAASPTFELQAFGPGTEAMDVFSLPDMEIPPPPDEIARPVAPIPVAEVAADALTIPPTTIDRNPADLLRPPGTGARADRQSVPFTPMTVRPYLQNADEIARALERFYPHALRQAGIGGTVHVWFHIDRDGRVAGTRLNESSGYDAFDEAALRVASQMRFSPAYNRDERVPVWVNIPITFEVQD